MARGRRWSIFIALLAAGIALSLVFSLALGRSAGWGFLLLPFIFPPFLFRGQRNEAAKTRECGSCGFATGDPEVRFCPRDGTLLAD